MSSFKLAEAIAEWRLSLQKQQGLEPGLIEELVSNLHDRIEDYQAEGLSEEEAFHKAKQKALANPEEVADEYFKATVSTSGVPPWKRKYDVMFLMPNYLKVAFRNFIRRKFYAAINYTALVVGLLISAVVFLFVQYELSYDTFHAKAENTYRVSRNLRSQGYSIYSFASFLVPALQNNSTRLMRLQILRE